MIRLHSRKSRPVQRTTYLLKDGNAEDDKIDGAVRLNINETRH